MADGTMGQFADIDQHPKLPNDWEGHREIIKRLYVNEDKALQEVVKEMEISHNFVATERMYKRRISDWDLDKNVKDEEMRAIIACRAMRLQQGEKSAFYVRGRLVDRKKIDRFAQRKGIDPMILDGVSVLPRGVRCITPSDDGPAKINTISEQPNRGRSKRRSVQTCARETKDTKRIRNLEEQIDDQTAPLGHRERVEQEGTRSALPNGQVRAQFMERESTGSSRQLLSSNTASLPNGASIQWPLWQPEGTPTRSDPVTATTIQLEWNSGRTFEYAQGPVGK